MKSSKVERRLSFINELFKKLQTYIDEAHRFSSAMIIFTLIIFTLMHLWIRWPALQLSYFHNEDTAGITYSADLILRGGLPLIDTVEMKSPGSFFILAGWWAWVGRSIENAQLLGVIWSWFAMLGVMMGAWVLYARKLSVIIAGGLYLYLAPFTDSIDINYGAWMIMPYTWSAVLLFIAYRSTNQTEVSDQRVNGDKLKNRQLFWWMLTGLMIAFAALMKRQGAAIFPLAFGLAFISTPHRKAAVSALLGGVGLGFILAFYPYMIRGHGIEAACHYFFSESGWSYLLSDLEQTRQSVKTQPSPARLPRFWDGISGLGVHVPLVGLLALLNVTSQWLLKRIFIKDGVIDDQSFGEELAWAAKSPPLQDHRGRHVPTLLILIGLSFVGTALGLRFFKGYYLQLIPGLIWLAVHPQGIPWTWRTLIASIKTRAKWVQQPILHSLLVLVLIGGGVQLPNAAHTSWAHLQHARSMRSRVLSLPTWQIKRVSYAIKRLHLSRSKNVQGSMTRDLESSSVISLWVWGRWAWPAYFYTQASCPTRYFKNLGVLTTQLTNTWNPKRRGQPTRFNPNTPWREAIQELSSKLPHFVITAHNEPLNGFHDLQKLLRTKYRRLNYRDLKINVKKQRELFTVYQHVSK